VGIAWAAEEALRDIKGPLALSYRFNFLLPGIIVFLVIVIVVAYILWKRRKLAPVVISPRPAHVIALEQLTELKARDLVGQGKIKEYYSEISDIIRHYLENRFVLRAPEMTTEEFLFYVRDYGQLVEGHKTLLKEFLSACDMVKFAKYSPTVVEMNAIYGSAENFVYQTKEEVVIPAQAGIHNENR
jgi:hypothetical protein